ncbi:anti-sigma factor family protein [Alienimonas chondri]|uniref:Anti-sigma factor n=1 Tax=Alienimonas chondri TaxID=2681879 RepID=A0ABX1V7V4_9PLAN|nr:hypothetical protein [Alienimonas chondri]NNJ24267.1 hypothetical protein [Alienimonas chondri]
MPQIARLSAEDRDDLVAYLDGELDGEAGGRIEKALSASPVARHEVEMLTRTWDLLDLLPAADPDREFTERTLAAAKALDDSVPLADRTAVHVAKGAGLLAAWATGLVAAAAIGYLAAAEWVPGASDPIVRDDPVLRDLPRLRDAHSEAFLKELNQAGVLVDLPPDLDPDAPAESPE